eukprot:756686-Hanusia_phi.AAC.2
MGQVADQPPFPQSKTGNLDEDKDSERMDIFLLECTGAVEGIRLSASFRLEILSNGRENQRGVLIFILCLLVSEAAVIGLLCSCRTCKRYRVCETFSIIQFGRSFCLRLSAFVAEYSAMTCLLCPFDQIFTEVSLKPVLSFQ